MSQLSIITVSNDSWVKLLDEWGGGKAQPRYIFEKDCTIEKFPNHQVLHGPSPAGGYTNSGFLVDKSGQVVGGVDGISTK